jgi:hypothetical protein
MNYDAWLKSTLDYESGPSERDYMKAEESVADYYADNPDEVGEWDGDRLIAYLAERIYEAKQHEY